VAINGKAVLRVIIEGEWIWVERGSFTVMALEFADDNGNVVNVSRDPIPAYYFVSTQGDPYFGPLSAISLFKLDNQTLEETGSGPPARGRPHELPEGSGETFGGVVGPRAADAGPDETPSDEGGDDERPPARAPKKPVPLFADDIDEDDLDEEPAVEAPGRRRGGGLF
jgi:hypothetical protein